MTDLYAAYNARNAPKSPEPGVPVKTALTPSEFRAAHGESVVPPKDLADRLWMSEDTHTHKSPAAAALNETAAVAGGAVVAILLLTWQLFLAGSMCMLAIWVARKIWGLL